MTDLSDQAYCTTFNLLNDMKDAVGKELGLSPWEIVTQEKINTFGVLTHDEQWIHMDVEKAKKDSPYKTPVAHGFFVLSLASHFSHSAFKVLDIGMGLNYGLDKVRFMNATPVDSKLRGRVFLLEFDEIQGGAKYKLKIIFEIEGVEKPACVAEFIAMVFRK